MAGKKPRKGADGADLKLQSDVATERTSAQSRLALLRKVRMFYDLQRLRMQTGGRLDPKAKGSEVELHEADLAVLDARAAALHLAEKAALKDIEDHLETLPIWAKVVSDRERFRGLGPTMAAVIFAENDISRQDTVSKMWSFAGLRPVPFKRCASCGVEISVEETNEGILHYTHPALKAKATCGLYDRIKLDRSKDTPLLDENVVEGHKAARPVRGQKLPYNSFLRTKLIGVLGPCLLKANSPWRKFYDDYKARKLAAGWGQSDGHRHNAAVRYMIKMLLVEIHREWRTIEGLPVRAPYQEEYLGHTHATG